MSFGWCFLGSGSIARQVARDGAGLRIVSVYSPTRAHAQAFAGEFGARAYDSPEQAIRAEGVDGVYVAAQHPEHLCCVMEALRLGKPVLCEKPLAVNARQAAQMIDEARSRGLYLAEAMWPRHNPVLQTAMDWVAQGQIGRPRYMTADFGSTPGPEGQRHRLVAPDRAGGALLDMGVYPLVLAQWVFGNPLEAHAQARLMETGVDESMAIQLRYADSAYAALFTAIDVSSRWTATIHGERGVIEIPQYWRAREAHLYRTDGEALHLSREGCVGHGCQMRAVEREISEGLLESPRMPQRDSLALARLTDELRRQAGVHLTWDD